MQPFCLIYRIRQQGTKKIKDESFLNTKNLYFRQPFLKPRHEEVITYPINRLWRV